MDESEEEQEVRNLVEELEVMEEEVKFVKKESEEEQKKADGQEMQRQMLERYSETR